MENTSSSLQSKTKNGKKLIVSSILTKLIAFYIFLQELFLYYLNYIKSKNDEILIGITCLQLKRVVFPLNH